MIQSYARWGLVHNSFKWHQSMHDGAYGAQQPQMAVSYVMSVILVHTSGKIVQSCAHVGL